MGVAGCKGDAKIVVESEKISDDLSIPVILVPD